MSQLRDHEDEAFVRRAKAVLDRTAADLDQAATLRLQRARLAAVSRRASWRPRLAWVSGLAVVAVVAVWLWGHQPPTQHPHAALPWEDVELVSSLENVELADDLDFYHWLAGDDTQG